MQYTNLVPIDNFGDASISTETLILIVVLAVWEMVWKGFAMWKAGRKNDPTWFVLLLVINTVGILPILYLYVFSKSKKEK